MSDIDEYDLSVRKSQDKHINTFGLILLTLCKEHDEHIVNGRLDDGKHICFTVNRRGSGCSLIYYLITGIRNFSLIKQFDVK